MTTADHMTGEVAVAPGWTLLPVARERMARRLARAADDIVAVAAVAGPLPAGQSARNHAEDLAVRTADPAAAVADGRTVPALVHREGVAVTVGPDGVALPDGKVVIDPGAHADRPRAAGRAVADAVEGCRPVFPWRPVVLVLGTEPDADGWADAVALVDALQDVDVDARLALPSPPSTTSRWVQPARASETHAPARAPRCRPRVGCRRGRRGGRLVAWAALARRGRAGGRRHRRQHRPVADRHRAGSGAWRPSGAVPRRPTSPPSSTGWPPAPSPRPPTRRS